MLAATAAPAAVTTSAKEERESERERGKGFKADERMESGRERGWEREMRMERGRDEERAAEREAGECVCAKEKSQRIDCRMQEPARRSLILIGVYYEESS